MKAVGLFSGIGGLELPLKQHGVETLLLCDSWAASRKVLASRFTGVPIESDVRQLQALPEETNLLLAGFPCTDLSQAGRTAGIRGAESGLVEHVFRLAKSARLDWLVLENVRNMLVLDGGRALHYLTDELAALGFAWAYRLVDSRFSGVPQRRHRVLFVASQVHDPREVLFADEAGAPPADSEREDAFGFYWTEGLRGLGWARDAVPPLKGGSTVGIPSPPAIWLPEARLGWRIVTPSVEDAEALQGFGRGWTAAASDGKREADRWKLIGNAVSVGVADWLASRLVAPGTVSLSGNEHSGPRWPNAAFGYRGHVYAMQASFWPQRTPYLHLRELLRSSGGARPLSARAASGFLARAKRSSLRFAPGFLADIQAHVDFWTGEGSSQARAEAG